MSEAPTPLPAPKGAPPPPAADAAPEGEPAVERRLVAELGGGGWKARLFVPESQLGAGPAPSRRRPRRERDAARPAAAGAGGDVVVSPMQGTVLRVLVEVGAEVGAGNVICIVEAMKMENEIAAKAPGRCASCPCPRVRRSSSTR